jgi:large subunit ribosomal protein L6
VLVIKRILKKNLFILRLGFSHRLFFRLPVTVSLTKTKKRPPTFLIKGFDSDLVKNTAFLLRSFKKPEPYKGKGVILLKEHIKLKEGKKTKTS